MNFNWPLASTHRGRARHPWRAWASRRRWSRCPKRRRRWCPSCRAAAATAPGKSRRRRTTSPGRRSRGRPTAAPAGTTSGTLRLYSCRWRWAILVIALWSQQRTGYQVPIGTKGSIRAWSAFLTGDETPVSAHPWNRLRLCCFSAEDIIFLKANNLAYPGGRYCVSSPVRKSAPWSERYKFR